MKLIYFLLLILSINLFSSNSGDYHSYYLVDIESGKVLDKKNPDLAAPLASVSKAFSLLYSLETLGADYKFETKLGISGEVKSGVLKGDLYLIGGGDPYLTSNHLLSLIQSLQKKEIKKVEGNFYFDSSIIPEKQRLDEIGLEDQTDNPSISGLNVEFNRFKVQTSTRKTIPSLEYIKISKEGNKKFDLKYSLKELNTQKEEWSLLPTGHKAWESLPSRSPGYFSANYFLYLSKIQGIVLPKPKFKKSKLGEYEILSIHRSLPLIEIATLALEYSNNLMAETPALMAEKALSEKLTPWLKKKFKSIPWKHTQFVNASGLTHQNLSSAKEVGLFLRNIFFNTYQDRSFPSLLSIAGHNGWLSNRLKSPELAFRVLAKTGSLHYVNNVAGYLFSESGKKLAFSILMYSPKKIEILNKSKFSNQAKKLRSKAGAWSVSAKSTQDQMLKSWIEKY